MTIFEIFLRAFESLYNFKKKSSEKEKFNQICFKEKREKSMLFTLFRFKWLLLNDLLPFYFEQFKKLVYDEL